MKKYPEYKIYKKGDKYCPAQKKNKLSRWDSYVCWVNKEDVCAIIERWKKEEVTTVHNINEICGDC